MIYPIQLTVNGEEYKTEVEPHQTLLEVLRTNLDLRGTKEGCSTGHCGACTVLIDGQPISSCLLLAVEADGRHIMTIEGLAMNGELHPIQDAFIANGGLQCGFCTAGMMMSTVALLQSNPQPTEEEIRYSLAGNLCRCTGYHKVIDAVLSAAEVMHHERA